MHINVFTEIIPQTNFYAILFGIITFLSFTNIYLFSNNAYMPNAIFIEDKLFKILAFIQVIMLIVSLHLKIHTIFMLIILLLPIFSIELLMYKKAKFKDYNNAKVLLLNSYSDANEYVFRTIISNPRNKKLGELFNNYDAKNGLKYNNRAYFNVAQQIIIDSRYDEVSIEDKLIKNIASKLRTSKKLSSEPVIRAQVERATEKLIEYDSNEIKVMKYSEPKEIERITRKIMREMILNASKRMMKCESD